MSRTIIVTGEPFGLRQVILIGPHQLVADEATEAASNDEGPDPYEYLLASLGACTNMTLRRYASHKGWPFKQIETTLSHSKSCAVDTEQYEQPAAMIERSDRRITLIGVGSPAPQWSATNNRADHSVRMVGKRDCGLKAVGMIV